MKNKSICDNCKKKKTCPIKKGTLGKIVQCPYKETKVRQRYFYFSPLLMISPTPEDYIYYPYYCKIHAPRVKK